MMYTFLVEVNLNSKDLQDNDHNVPYLYCSNMIYLLIDPTRAATRDGFMQDNSQTHTVDLLKRSNLV